jgi:hypothetical protein
MCRKGFIVSRMWFFYKNFRSHIRYCFRLRFRLIDKICTLYWRFIWKIELKSFKREFKRLDSWESAMLEFNLPQGLRSYWIYELYFIWWLSYRRQLWDKSQLAKFNPLSAQVIWSLQASDSKAILRTEWWCSRNGNNNLWSSLIIDPFLIYQS